MKNESLSRPTVSVVIPAYKAAGTICRAVESVLTQTVPAYEIIIVDDGSPDNVSEVVERTYGGKVVLVRKPNGGAASARNAGIDVAKGEFIAFLDADDYWDDDKLERQLAVFQQYPGVGIIAGRYFEQTPGEMRQEIWTPPRAECDRIRKEHGSNAFRLATLMWTGTVIVRRDQLADDRFVSGLEPAEDRDLWARLVARCEAYLLSEPLATAVIVPGSLSRSNIDRDCSNMLRVAERNRHLLGAIGVRQWRAYTLYRRSIGPDTSRSALLWLLKSLCTWPLPFVVVPVQKHLRMDRLRRLAVLLRAQCRVA